MEKVILVDEHDREIGTMEKMEAHRLGKLHRAFSVVVFNSSGEMLIQKRASEKYHSAGLWSNACCSHPRPGEEIETAVRRRLREELGIDINPEFSFKFIYSVRFPNNLIEHELDHVFVGTYDGEPTINKKEASDWKFIDPKTLATQINFEPESFTHWFKIILDRFENEPETSQR